MEHYKGMPGLGVDRNYQMPSKYFAPMRLIVADIGHTGEYTLLINKPISTAAQIFDRYRYFPQGEVHALFWDGVGLALKWKTRRIRGSVAAVDLADFNNDGVLARSGCGQPSVHRHCLSAGRVADGSQHACRPQRL